MRHAHEKQSMNVPLNNLNVFHNRDLWDYLSNLSIDMNRLTDSVKEDPDKIAIHLKTAPERRYKSF